MIVWMPHWKFVHKWRTSSSVAYYATILLPLLNRYVHSHHNIYAHFIIVTKNKLLVMMLYTYSKITKLFNDILVTNHFRHKPVSHTAYGLITLYGNMHVILVYKCFIIFLCSIIDFCIFPNLDKRESHFILDYYMNYK